MNFKIEAYRFYNDIFNHRGIKKWLEEHDRNIPAYSIIQAFTHKKLVLDTEYVLPLIAKDFIVCKNLMDTFPDWWEHLECVKVKYPDWKHFFVNWNKLSEKINNEKSLEKLVGKINAILSHKK